MAKRATTPKVEERVQATVTMLLDGHSRGEILIYFAELGIGDRQVDEYISRAVTLIRAEALPDLSVEYRRSLTRLDSLYSAVLEKGDQRTTLAVEMQKQRLLGISRAALATVPTDAPPIASAADLLARVSTQLAAEQHPDPDARAVNVARLTEAASRLLTQLTLRRLGVK